jgi:hypothetical protein
MRKGSLRENGKLKYPPYNPPLKMHFPLKLECCQLEKTPNFGQIEAIGRAMGRNAESRHARLSAAFWTWHRLLAPFVELPKNSPNSWGCLYRSGWSWLVRLEELKKPLRKREVNWPKTYPARAGFSSTN